MSWGALFESCHALAVERWQGKTVSLDIDSTRRPNGELAVHARVCVQGTEADPSQVIASIYLPDRYSTHEQAITAVRKVIAADAWKLYDPGSAKPDPDEPLAFGGGR